MAIKQSLTLASGETGDHWILEQNNNSSGRDNSVVTLQLYFSEQTRAEKKPPLKGSNASVQFTFSPNDHDLSTFDEDTLDITLVENFKDLEKHVRYQHIMNISVIAKAKQDVIDGSETPKEEPKLSDNEREALYFFGGERVE